MKGLHPFLILFSVIVLAAIATWFMPAGQYERAEVDGTEVVVDGTYTQTEAEPAGLIDILTSVQLGMVDAAQIIFFIFIVGGAFGVLSRTRTVEDGIRGLAERMKGSELFLIPVLMLVFALAGATFGMFEEALPFILILVPIALRLGFDSITGAAIVLVGVSVGFTAAVTNPFTVGVAQGIAEVPTFSGMGYRIVVLAVMLTISIAYVMWYARKVRRDPERSLTFTQDQARRTELENEQEDPEERRGLSGRQIAILVILLATLGALVWGTTTYGWYMTEIAALFLAMGLVMGLVGGLGLNGTFEAFGEGCKDMVLGALCVGFAYGTLTVLTDAGIIDTILYSITNAISGMHAAAAALGMLGVQSLLNFIVTSGSGQAALTMPIMTPLADLLDVSRQTAVLAFQMGDGISNIFAPTSGLLLAALAMGRIGYGAWFRFIWPLIAVHYLLAAIMVTIAHVWVWPG